MTSSLDLYPRLENSNARHAKRHNTARRHGRRRNAAGTITHSRHWAADRGSHILWHGHDAPERHGRDRLGQQSDAEGDEQTKSAQTA